jgi:Virus neck protein
MATSQYFNNYNALTEQRVVEDLIVESIKIMGFDAFYLPNDNDAARDLLYGEDPIKKFQSAFPVEFYLSSSLEYMGEKEFFSKFGLEIKNNINVILSKRSFSQRVPQNTFTRPREGDLIYVPFLNGTGELFEIKFVNQTKDFFTLGRKIPFFYELEMEKFKYSQEVISTGVPDIDVIVDNSAYTIDLELGTGTGSYIYKETVFQSLDNTQANATTVGVVSSWDNATKMLAVTNIAGEFTDNVAIIGETSNAHYLLNTFDPMAVELRNEKYDNLYINQQANTIIDFSESNPFGAI